MMTNPRVWVLHPPPSARRVHHFLPSHQATSDNEIARQEFHLTAKAVVDLKPVPFVRGIVRVPSLVNHGSLSSVVPFAVAFTPLMPPFVLLCSAAPLSPGGNDGRAGGRQDGAV